MRERERFEAHAGSRRPAPPTVAGLLAWVTFFVIASLPLSAGAQQENTTTGGLQPSDVEIAILGSPHLRQIDLDRTPVAVEVVRSRLSRFEPDLVVVEWLHPEVDRSEAFNYRSLGDLATLARLWGYRRDDIDSVRAEALSRLKREKEKGLPTAPTRLELGKLHYLAGDQLNAGYQWWRAQRLGADVTDLRRLTSDNFRGHELRVWGFEVARVQDHEYLVPFDYQGDDTGWDVWGRMLERLRTVALLETMRLEPGEPGWEEERERFDELRGAFEENGDPRWVERYGDSEVVLQYARAWNGFGEVAEMAPAETDGLTRLRWWQGEEYLDAERRLQYELIAGISVDGLGQARTDGNLLRNQRMADFVEGDIRRLDARRVLVIVGYGHKHFLEDIFAERGYRLVPSRGLLRPRD